jgi:hypothetical protein
VLTIEGGGPCTKGDLAKLNGGGAWSVEDSMPFLPHKGPLRRGGGLGPLAEGLVAKGGGPWFDPQNPLIVNTGVLLQSALTLRLGTAAQCIRVPTVLYS